MRLAATMLVWAQIISPANAQVVSASDFPNPSHEAQEPLQDSLDDKLIEAQSVLWSSIQEGRSSPIVISSLANPRVARMIRIPKDGQQGLRSSWCGATLISSTAAITAAHCVCSYRDNNNPKDEKECVEANNLNKFEYYLFFPAFGVRRIEKFSVHPEYIRPSIEIFSKNPTPTADIAILFFDAAIPVSEMELGSPAPKEVFVLASYGSFGTSSSDAWRKLGLEPNSDYSEGLGHFSVLNQTILQRPGTCAGEATDTYCYKYIPGNSNQGDTILDDAAACHGDSGSPLLLLSEENGNLHTRLAGISTYVNPPVSDCSQVRDRTTNFVDVSAYSEWIASNVLDETETTDSDLDLECGEHTLQIDDGSYLLPYENLEGILTLQSVGLLSAGGIRPTVSVASDDLQCVTFSEVGAHSCIKGSDNSLQIAVRGPGLVQFSVCKPKD